MHIDYKALKKLADSCRKAGIKHFKNADFEFTLTDEAPVSQYRKRIMNKGFVKQAGPVVDDAFKTESLTDEQLLMWSTVNIADEDKLGA